MFKRLIEIKYFDLPELHINTKLGKEFWGSLANTEDLNLFNTEAVQILVNFKWNRIEGRIFKKYLYPYIVFLIVFSTWSNLIHVNHMEPIWREINWCTAVILLIECAYFMKSEISQMQMTGPCDYFSDGWNYLDILPLVFIPILTLWGIFDTILSYTDMTH